MIDIKKVSKLLELTSSPFDGEALNAIRKANMELMKNDITWTMLLSNKIINITSAIHEPSGVDEKLKKHDEIKRMLIACLSIIRSESGLRFIQSLKQQYDISGHLSEKQIAALHNWYDKL